MSVFIAHKLGRALTPARGVQALSGEEEASPERGGPLLKARGPRPPLPVQPLQEAGVPSWGPIRSNQTEGAARAVMARVQSPPTPGL